MRTISAFLLAAGLTAAVVADDFPTDQELIARALAVRQEAATGGSPNAQAAQPAQVVDELSRQEREARVELTMSLARVELLMARKSLRATRYADAARRAKRVLGYIAQLPAEKDASVYELQAEGVLAKVARAGIDVEAMRAAEVEGPDLKAARRMANAMNRLPAGVRGAAQVARRFDGADTRDVDTTGQTEPLRKRTLRNQLPNDYGYNPGREIIDVDGVLARDNQRLYYEGALHTAVTANEAHRLTNVEEARLAPDGVVSYPDNWRQTIAKRARYADGEIARSKTWTDDEGREWYVALYDIRDLTYLPPDFQPTLTLDPGESLRNAEDRAALRLRSEIFSGYAEELAAGIPLLRYFGGVDDFAFRGPKYSYERQQQIVKLIKAFTERLPEAKTEVIGP